MELSAKDPLFAVSRRVRDFLTDRSIRTGLESEVVDTGLGGATRIVLVGDDAHVSQLVPG